MINKIKFNKKLIFLILITLCVFPVITANAQDPSVDIPAIIDRVQIVLNNIAASLVAVMFVLAGITYLTARGEPGKIQLANKMIFWGAIGAGVGLLSALVIDWVFYIFLGI